MQKNTSLIHNDFHEKIFSPAILAFSLSSCKVVKFGLTKMEFSHDGLY
jgi:hypothetical protein